jgi:1-acyl-sn-glycerol-3-phosphate acyltransferase
MQDEQAFATLSWMERIAFRVMRFLNQGLGRRAARIWQRGVVTPLVGWLLVYRRLRVYGIERLDGIPQDAPILLVTNHRTFFDLFILGWLLIRHPRLSRRVNFPVRSNFFYETPLGLLMSALLTGGSMFPPFFRSAEKKAMNRYSLDILLEKLRTPGEMVGFHPEGTRNKTDDPYTLLPAQPGAGELALKARPVVVPAFILGMTNHFWTEVKANRRRTPLVIAVFGKPVELPEIAGETRLSHHKKFADLLNERIAALGAEERALRSAASAPASPAQVAK